MKSNRPEKVVQPMMMKSAPEQSLPRVEGEKKISRNLSQVQRGGWLCVEDVCKGITMFLGWGRDSAGQGWVVQT